MSDIIDRLRGLAPSIPAMRDGASEIESLRRRVSALETQNGNLRAAFRANMLRYAPPDGVDAEIDRVLEWCSATGSYDFAPTDPHHGGKIWKP